MSEDFLYEVSAWEERGELSLVDGRLHGRTIRRASLRFDDSRFAFLTCLK